MDHCTLNWTSDRGFELDLDVVVDDVALSMAAVPVPADGTVELGVGVDLFPLDVLFKSQVVIDGEPGQVQQATVRLVGSALEITARVEDVETGEIVPVSLKVPAGVPASGGPKPQPADEDELDWEDETTLEKMVVEPGDKSPSGASGGGDEPSPKALQALLRALVNGPDDELTDEQPLEDDEEAEVAPPRLLSKPPAAASDIDDQSMTAEAEARSLLELLVNGDNLELEEDHEIEELVDGVKSLLARALPPEGKATRLSAWLLDHEAVADLFIGDEDLAEILAEW